MKKLKIFTFFVILFLCFISLYAFDFVLLGDNRPSYNQIEPNKIFLQIETSIRKNTAIKFIINTGDIISGYNLDKQHIKKEWDAFYNYLKTYPIPYYIALGNHDVFNQNFSLNYYLKKFNLPKPYYSFDYKNAHFIILCTVEPNYKHQISPEQFKWLKNDLKKNQGKIIFVVGHEPIFPVAEHIGSSLDTYPEFQKKFFNLLKKYHVYAYLCGHEHLFNVKKIDGIYQFISGGAGATLRTPIKYGGFFHYIIFHVNKKNVSYDLIKFPTKKFPFRKYIKDRIYIEYHFFNKKLPKQLSVYYTLTKNGKILHKRMKQKDDYFYIYLKKFSVKKIYLYFKDENGNIYKYKNKKDFRIWLK